MRYLTDKWGRKEYVDGDDECQKHHKDKTPPRFHLVHYGKALTTAILCAKSLTADERGKLKEGKP